MAFAANSGRPSGSATARVRASVIKRVDLSAKKPSVVDTLANWGRHCGRSSRPMQDQDEEARPRRRGACEGVRVRECEGDRTRLCHSHTLLLSHPHTLTPAVAGG